MVAPDDRVASIIAEEPALVAEVRRALPILRNSARLGAGAEGVRRALGIYLAVYPPPHRSEGEWAAWWLAYEQILADLPESALMAGMVEWTRRPDSRFMPAPGELLEMARKATTPEGVAYARAKAAVDLADQAERPATPRMDVQFHPMRNIKTEEMRAWARNEAAKFRAASLARSAAVREARAPKGPPLHGALAPGRHITPEMVALLGLDSAETAE